MSDEDAFKRYVERVLGGEYPTDPRVPLPPMFVNGAGRIQNLILQPGPACTSVIWSDARTLRSSHYHERDWHFLYVLSGSMLYYEREVGDTHLPEPLYFGAGQMCFTPPMREHATAFPEAAVLVSVSRFARDTKSHEGDVVRIPFLSPEVLGWR